MEIHVQLVQVVARQQTHPEIETELRLNTLQISTKNYIFNLFT